MAIFWSDEILIRKSFLSVAYSPIEFHWYSAEEGGLLGSQEVAQRYAAQQTRVKSMYAEICRVPASCKLTDVPLSNRFLGCKWTW